MANTEKDYTTDDVVKIMGVSPRTVRHWIREGVCPAYDVSRPSSSRPSYRIKPGDVDVLRKNLAVVTKPAPQTKKRRFRRSSKPCKEFF